MEPQNLGVSEGKLGFLGEELQVSHCLVASVEPVQHKIASEKVGYAGDDDGHGVTEPLVVAGAFSADARTCLPASDGF